MSLNKNFNMGIGPDVLPGTGPDPGFNPDPYPDPDPTREPEPKSDPDPEPLSPFPTPLPVT